MRFRAGTIAAVALALGAGGTQSQAQAPSQPTSDTLQSMVGAWEISNADRDRRCAATFGADQVPRGHKLELDPACGDALPDLKDVVAWVFGPNDAVRLIDGAGTVVVEFTEVENGLYEAERKGEGLLFLQTQAAIKAETKTAEELFGDWKVLREIDRPLCTLTLSGASSGGEGFRLVVKPGCDQAIAGLGLSAWKFDRNQLVLTGRNTSLRFAESDSVTWERIPLSVDPLLLMRQ
jgi:hypothetical protein